MFVAKVFSRITIVILSLLLIVFTTQISLAAGSGSIKGRVMDKSTNEALIGANVVIQNTSLGIAADIDGNFNVRSIPVGTWTVKVSYMGYQSVSLEINVTEDVVIEKDFQLEPQSIMGEEVVVTAQARGQQTAINQQLASNTISNIVAADRIKELPDASAAESIGRLPGISIDRYNGEATGVAIRGLSPKYNMVTVNGVALPATNNNDRSVDLSLISSNLLDGIEVKKANTADMDADALGGTIDLRLREAPEEFQVNGGLQGGYNNLVSFIGNYSAYASVSNRFLDNKLGVIIGFNTDRNNRTADKLNVTYRPEGAGASSTDVRLNTFQTRREEAIKTRLGGNILLDYKIPNGKVAFNGFYNQATTDGTYRQNQKDFIQNKIYRLTTENISTTSIYTLGLSADQDYGWIKFDVGLSATGSLTDDPQDWQWQFNQESATQSGYPTVGMTLDQIYSRITSRDSSTLLASVYLYSRNLSERTKTAQFNVEVPYKLGDNLSGYLKAGGKFRWVTRDFNQEQWGRAGMSYGGFWSGVAQTLTHDLSVIYPEDFNYIQDSISIANAGNWILPRFNKGYSVPSNFLGGDYKLGSFPDMGLLRKVADVFRTLTANNNWQRQSIGSLGADYDGIEHYRAFYVMTNLNIGSKITVIPGIRYDADYTKYHGQTFKAVNSSSNERPPIDYSLNENVRENSFWLPQIHIKYQPLEWLRIHIAGTETVTRPDYLNYAPITTIDSYGNTLNAANAALKDSRSKNLDISLSVYEAHVGLVTVSGFYKKIDNLIMYQGISSVNRPLYRLLVAEGIFDINAPLTWFVDPPGSVGSAPTINTYINNPSPAQYRGVEFDYQTNFWYLPSVFKGLVFNLNWTYIVSQIELHSWWTRSTAVWHYDPGPPEREWWTYEYSTYKTRRQSRMPGQPAHIFNTTLGYDYKGFSVRVSYIYQSDKFTNSGPTNLTDQFSHPYDRWDLAIQQRLTSNIQLYANFNNLTNTHDESQIGYSAAVPATAQYYGQTIDAGVRVNF